jgi:hypothetical protein
MKLYWNSGVLIFSAVDFVVFMVLVSIPCALCRMSLKVMYARGVVFVGVWRKVGTYVIDYGLSAIILLMSLM